MMADKILRKLRFSLKVEGKEKLKSILEKVNKIVDGKVEEVTYTIYNDEGMPIAGDTRIIIEKENSNIEEVKEVFKILIKEKKNFYFLVEENAIELAVEIVIKDQDKEIDYEKVIKELEEELLKTRSARILKAIEKYGISEETYRNKILDKLSEINELLMQEEPEERLKGYLELLKDDLLLKLYSYIVWGEEISKKELIETRIKPVMKVVEEWKIEREIEERIQKEMNYEELEEEERKLEKLLELFRDEEIIKKSVINLIIDNKEIIFDRSIPFWKKSEILSDKFWYKIKIYIKDKKLVIEVEDRDIKIEIPLKDLNKIRKIEDTLTYEQYKEIIKKLREVRDKMDEVWNRIAEELEKVNIEEEAKKRVEKKLKELLEKI